MSCARRVRVVVRRGFREKRYREGDVENEDEKWNSFVATLVSLLALAARARRAVSVVSVSVTPRLQP